MMQKDPRIVNHWLPHFDAMSKLAAYDHSMTGMFNAGEARASLCPDPQGFCSLNLASNFLAVRKGSITVLLVNFKASTMELCMSQKYQRKRSSEWPRPAFSA